LGGSSQYEILNTLQDLSKPQGPSGYLTMADKNYGLVLRERTSAEFSKFDLEKKGLISGKEKIIKVADFGSLNLENTTNALHKEDRQYLRLVSFEYLGSAKFGNEYLDEILKEMKSQMPIGYEAKKQEWGLNTDQAKRQYGLLGILIVAIFFICTILFENFRQPFFILFLIPISFIGLFLTFSLGEFNFDRGGFAAFVMLGGLAVNAGIFILNDFNNRLRGNYNRNIIKSVAGKAIPILLTVLSTCFGLVPFILDGQTEVFWFSLAVGTIGGLVFSMVGVFLILPVLMWKRG
jgi:multidrug efflux pump subunit AcrB